MRRGAVAHNRAPGSFEGCCATTGRGFVIARLGGRQAEPPPWAHVVLCALGCALAGAELLESLTRGGIWGRAERDPPLLEADDGDGGVPEAFEVVVGPLFGGEEVEDDVAVVQEHPAGVRVALAAHGLHLFGGQGFFDGVDDGVHLAGGAGGGEDKIIGEGRDAADVQQQDVLRLLFGEGVYDLVGEFVGLQSPFFLRDRSPRAG